MKITPEQLEAKKRIERREEKITLVMVIIIIAAVSYLLN